MKRAKQHVYDIAMMNDFKYFITWTLDKTKIDRENVDEIKKKLQAFLNNMQQRYNVSYILIPEYHSDGKAIHIHGLINGSIKLVDSNLTTSEGKTIYNMPQWKYGFSTAIELDDRKEAVSHYITKYISKDFRKIFGKFYYSSRDLIRTPAIQLYNTDYDGMELPEYSIPQAGLKFKYI